MAINYGQSSTGALLKYPPERLTLVKDRGHVLYDPNVDLAFKEDLVKDFIAVGILVPVIVRENGRYEDDHPQAGARIIEVVDGRKRVTAALEANRRLREAGKPEIMVPATMASAAGDGAVARHILTATNELRYEDAPSHRAAKAAKMREAGASDNDVALAFGVSVTEAKHLIALAGLDKESKAAVDDGILPLRDASKLTHLPDTKRSELVKEARGTTDKKAARKKVAKEASARKAPARAYTRSVRTKDEIEAAIVAIGEALGEGAGAKAIRALEWAIGKRETWT